MEGEYCALVAGCVKVMVEENSFREREKDLQRHTQKKRLSSQRVPDRQTETLSCNSLRLIKYKCHDAAETKEEITPGDGALDEE